MTHEEQAIHNVNGKRQILILRIISYVKLQSSHNKDQLSLIIFLFRYIKFRGLDFFFGRKIL